MVIVNNFLNTSPKKTITATASSPGQGVSKVTTKTNKAKPKLPYNKRHLPSVSTFYQGFTSSFYFTILFLSSDKSRPNVPPGFIILFGSK